MLIGFLISLFFSSFDGLLLVPDLDKYVKEYVIDDSKKEQALTLFKDQKKLVKGQNKKNKKWSKQWRKLIKEESSSRQSFETLQTQYISEFQDFQKASISCRIKLLALFSDEEWSQILLEIEKDEDKRVKQNDKLLVVVKKELDVVKENMIQESLDEHEKEVAIELFNQVEINTLKYIEVKNNMNFTNNILLRSKYTNAEELTDLYDLNNDAAADLLSSFVNIHFELLNSLTEDEWNDLQKALNKMFS